MRIGIVAYPLGSRGGVYRWANATADLLAVQGHAVHLVVGSRPDPTAWTRWSWSPRAASLHPMPVLDRWPSLDGSRRLTELTRALGLNVVIAVQWYSVAVSLLGPVRPARLVIDVQGGFPPAFKGLLYRGLAGLLVRRADAVVAASEHLFTSMPALKRCRRRVVIPNWVSSSERLADSGRASILYVGRLEPDKGVGDLLRLFRLLDGVDVTVAGDGGLAGDVRAAAEELPHVSYLGWVDNPTRLYRSHRYVILPSLEEGFGYVLVEAILHGAVPIVRDLPIAEELGVPSSWRFGAIDEVPTLISALEERPPTAVARRQAALRERVAARVDPSVVGAQWKELLTKVSAGP